MEKYLKNYIEKNIKNILFILFFITIGLVMGIVMFETLDVQLKESIIAEIKNNLEMTKKSGFEGINMISNGIFFNVIIISIIYFSVITFIPKIIINLVSTLKGISMGMYVATLFSIFNIGNAVVISIFLILLPNIIYIPAYIFICDNALLLHVNIENKNLKLYKLGIEVIKIIIGFSMIFLSILLEQISVISIINRYVKL